jgi:hypothetical protein
VRCYYVLVHAKLNWVTEQSGTDVGDATKPGGFLCHRYVLAGDEAKAAKTAFQRVRANLDDQTGWLRDGLATMELQAEEVATAPMHKLLKPDNRGHTFYNED